MASDRFGELYLAACLTELRALKPGNVSEYAAGHGMQVDDFVASAQASRRVIAEPGYGLGERIYRAIEATRAVVDHNTNLGIVLLCAPLLQAAMEASEPLRMRVGALLEDTSVVDADWVYRAIRLAEPGGMGASDRHDIAADPEVDLRTTMTEAADRDLIARQYTNGFREVFDFGMPRLVQYRASWRDDAWAATMVYLGWLQYFPDSLVARKCGDVRAREISAMIPPFEAELRHGGPPTSASVERLLTLDTELKNHGVNPGTTADLTVATLLGVYLQDGLAG